MRIHVHTHTHVHYINMYMYMYMCTRTHTHIHTMSVYELSMEEMDACRRELRVGLHEDIQVTAINRGEKVLPKCHNVNQVMSHSKHIQSNVHTHAKFCGISTCMHTDILTCTPTPSAYVYIQPTVHSRTTTKTVYVHVLSLPPSLFLSAKHCGKHAHNSCVSLR
jgi:hypothetical protein